MSGQMYHRTPSVLFPDGNQKPKYSQIYVYDEEHELGNRMEYPRNNNYADKINEKTLKTLQDQLKEHNHYVRQFKAGAKIFKDNPEKKLKMVFKEKGSAGARRRTKNPAVTDVCVIAPGDQTHPRDVIVYRTKTDHPHEKDIVTINELHAMYDPAAYPLILTEGEDGFSLETFHKTNGSKISMLEFYQFHIQVCAYVYHLLHQNNRTHITQIQQFLTLRNF